MQLTNSWMERGIEQGLEQERRSAILGLLELRYGAIDDQLAAILPTLMALTSIEYTPLIYQLSKEELIQHLPPAKISQFEQAQFSLNCQWSIIILIMSALSPSSAPDNRTTNA